MTRPGWSTRSPIPVLPAGAAAALVLVCVAVLSLPAVPEQVQAAVTNLVQLVVSALACATALWRARRSTGHRRSAWCWAGVGCGGWAAGQLVWCWYEVLQQRDAPFPSVADAGFLLLPLAMSVALFRFAGPAGWRQRRRLLDALTVTAALAMVSWSTVLRVVVDAGAQDELAFAVALAYPAGDLVLLVLTALMLTAATRDRWALGLLAGGLLAFAAADSAFALQAATGAFSSGEPADLGWVLGFALMALAPLAATGGRTVADAPPERELRLSALPYLAVVLAVLVVVGRQLGDGELTRGEEFLARLTVGLVLLRQFITLRENGQLVDELAAREEQLRHQAFHDGLTGLANRALFADRLAHALELHRSDLRPLAVLLCDLNDFKVVNDTLGHAAGDELLKLVAERLRGALRSADTLARLGGDEFAVLLEHGDQAEVTAARVVDALTAPFHLAGTAVTVRASVGVAVVPAEAVTPEPGALLGQADTAMYAAKRSGKRSVRVFEPGMSLVEVQEGRLADALRSAVAARQIDVVFQPVVTVATGAVEGVECLARWTWEGQQVPPSEFVPVAERTGLVADLTDLVLERACAQLIAWDSELGRTDLRVGVNVAPQDLVGGTLPTRVAAALARHGVAADRLVLEITESALLTDLDAARTASTELRRTGVRLALDDFGVGYSSLAHLHAIPLQILKIDRRFTAGLGADPGQARFVRALLSLGRDLGLHVVAEGVERPEQLGLLRAMGCEMAQGYLLARPSAPDQLAELLVDGVPALAAGRRTRPLPVPRLP